MDEAIRSRRRTVLIEATRGLPEVLNIGWDLVVTSRLIMGAPALEVVYSGATKTGEAVWVPEDAPREVFPAHRLPGVGWVYTVETDEALIGKLVEELAKRTDQCQGAR